MKMKTNIKKYGWFNSKVDNEIPERKRINVKKSHNSLKLQNILRRNLFISQLLLNNIIVLSR